MYPLQNWKKLKRTYTFGVKTHYNDFHLGLDLSVPVGTPIYAHEDGFVSSTFGKQGGNTLFLVDKYNKLVRFLHLSKIEKVGNVKKGDIIGFTGNTGLSTGPHLHVDISKNGKLDLDKKSNFVDPDMYFTDEEPKKLSVCLIANTILWENLQEKINYVANSFSEKTGGKLLLDFSIVHATFSTDSIEWVKGSENYIISTDFVKENFISRAKGKDICVYVQEHKGWHKEAADAYAENSDQAKYGMQFIAMKAEKNGVRRGGDEFCGRLIHELCHTLNDLANKTDDNVHEHDYKKPSEWWKSIEWIDFNSLPSNREGQVVKTKDNTKVYIIEDGKRRWIENEPTYYLYTGKSLSEVQILSVAELQRYPIGKEIRFDDQPEKLKQAVVFAARNHEYVKKILNL